MSLLHLCITQEEVTIPYKFKITNISVYSLEEAAYHCYHYWRQCYDEFLSDDFLDWVRNVLGLNFIASKISQLADVSSICDRATSFLSILGYFDHTEI